MSTSTHDASAVPPPYEPSRIGPADPVADPAANSARAAANPAATPAAPAISPLLRPARGAMILAAVLTSIGAVFSMLPYIAVTEMAAAFASGAGSRTLWIWTAVAVGGLLLGAMLYGLGIGHTHTAELKLRRDLRSQLVDAIGRMPLGRVQGISPGALRKIVSDDTTSIHTLVAHLAGDMANAATSLAVGLIYLFWVDWKMTLTLIGIWVVVVVFVILTSGMKGYGSLVADFSQKQQDLSAATVETVGGIKEIKGFQAVDERRSRFETARIAFTDLSCRWTLGGPGRAVAIIGAFLKPATVLATVAPVAALFIAQGWIEPAYTLAFFLVGLGLPSGLVQFATLGQHLYEAQQGAVGTASMLSAPRIVEGADREDDGPAPGEVCLENVTFGYDPEEPVLHDVSLLAAPGTVTALVGPSGGGKSTIARLVARFYDVDQGAVKVSGVDVREVSSDWLLSRVAIVLQDVALAHDTVRANIAMGRPDASEEQIHAAARAACIHERIMRLPKGYDTVIGEADGVLSGGEKQRLTIARAHVLDAPVLVLDEATAQADPRSEREIHQALGALCEGRTVLVIAHRLATVQDADQILVVDGGRIVEQGRHAELLEADGTYARLWHRQQPTEAADAEATDTTAPAPTLSDPAPWDAPPSDSVPSAPTPPTPKEH